MKETGGNNDLPATEAGSSGYTVPAHVPPQLLRAYNSNEHEAEIYTTWEKSGLFNPDKCIEAGFTKPDAKAFTIMMPPPNVTGVLHMGHAMMLTLEDVMIRFKRMQGYKTLWLPGTDHAAIATQSKVEKEISKKEGKSRHDLGREELLNRVRAFAQESHDTIVSQVRVMGASCDWSREAFTLDATRNRAVNTMFKRMYDDGLIYRGHRIVNWDPKGQTTIADDEIVYVEEKSKFYYFKYGPFVIGTARPETKFGDKYVVMHPEDARYAEYKHGDTLTVEWINGPIEATIIKDEVVDMEFGTGVMTITPWHSVVDFELAEKHKLDKEQIIDKYGKLFPIAGEFAGMKIKDARDKIVEKLAAKGLVEKIEDYTHNVGTAERTGGIIEPQVMNQWFVAVNKEFTLPYSNISGISSGSKTTLKELMRKTVSEKQIKIIPDYFDKTYFHWIDNLRDWCISRQIWYGHRIPVWYDEKGATRLPKEITLYLARHGESEFNISKTFRTEEETANTPLTEKGILDAKALAKSLQGKKITKILRSNLPRAKQTAEIVVQELGRNIEEIEIWEDLKEVLLSGTWAGQEKPDSYNPFEYMTESLSEVEERGSRILEKLKQFSDGEHILVIGHNAMHSVLRALHNNLPKEKFIENREKIGLEKNGSCFEMHLIVEPQEENLTQDEDTLDTWFSSGLWTFSTLGWPDKTKDLAVYHPTDVLETGYEILFFWVARMILMTGYALGEIPFHTVYLHGTVRDGQGRKMSKSLGNGIDPLDIAEKFGADAGRIALIAGTAPGTDSKISEDKIKGYKHFANKLWNITRFVLTYTDGVDMNAAYETTDQAIIAEWNALKKEITSEYETYKFHLVSEKIYQFAWYRFADVILEESKKILAEGSLDEQASRKKLLREILRELVLILHPLMPFVTEAIWETLPESNGRLVMVSEWPQHG
jgi:valyl-tRNA synthetase